MWGYDQVPPSPLLLTLAPVGTPSTAAQLVCLTICNTIHMTPPQMYKRPTTLLFWFVRLVPNGDWEKHTQAPKGLKRGCVALLYMCTIAVGMDAPGHHLTTCLSALGHGGSHSTFYAQVVKAEQKSFIRQSLVLFAWVASYGSEFYSINTMTTFAHWQHLYLAKFDAT